MLLAIRPILLGTSTDALSSLDLRWPQVYIRRPRVPIPYTTVRLVILVLVVFYKRLGVFVYP